MSCYEVFNLFGSWFGTFQPAELNFTDGFFLFSIIIAVVVGTLVFFYLSHFSTNEESNTLDRSTWIKQAFLFGFAATLLGPLPVWLTDRGVLWGLYGGRFGFAAEFGLSVLLFAILEWLTVKPLPKILIVSVLVGLAAGYHIRTARLYELSSNKQDQFYWQLYWRAPYIKPGTAILSSDELFTYVGRNSTSMALNLLYPQPADSATEGYWFLEVDYDFSPKTIPLLPEGRTLSRNFRNFSFVGDSRDSVVIDYSTSKSHCLWVLSPQDVDNLDLPELTRMTVPVSNLDRIVAEPISNDYPAQDAFGKEPEHTWCYYFQKADLARQLGEWQTIVQLGDEARDKGYQPADANEWLPFIEGYARSGQWDESLILTKIAVEMKPDISPRLCDLFSRIGQETTIPTTSQGQIEGFLNCSFK